MNFRQSRVETLEETHSKAVRKCYCGEGSYTGNSGDGTGSDCRLWEDVASYQFRIFPPLLLSWHFPRRGHDRHCMQACATALAVAWACPLEAKCWR